MKRDIPWTLNENETKVKKSPYIKNKESDKAVSTARILRVFEESPKGKFTNRDIANLLFVSESTVSNVTNKLIALGDIKIVGRTRSTAAIIYQHISGPDKFEVVFDKTEPVIEIRNFFRNHKNQTCTSKELVENFGYSRSIVSVILRTLLLNGTIKLVSIDQDTAQYQYKTGGKKTVEIFTTPDEEYCTISKYVKDNNIKKVKSEDVLTKLKSTQPRLFYSSQGVLKEYKKDKIAKTIDTLQNGNVLKKMWNKVSL